MNLNVENDDFSSNDSQYMYLNFNFLILRIKRIRVFKKKNDFIFSVFYHEIIESKYLFEKLMIFRTI